jgi:hypothetical protein
MTTLRLAPVPLAAVTVMLAAGAALSGCAPTPASDSGSSSATATPAPTATTTASPSPTSSPSPTAGATRIPEDCRAILTDAVLAQLGETPLNDPAFGPTGVQPDGSLVCVWRDPRADTTGVFTTISPVAENPTMDMLNTLADTEGFTCYQPDAGVRCEKTWQSEQYPVTDGRTLYYRAGVLIDTQYSNLAPTGYTDAIVASVFGG